MASRRQTPLSHSLGRHVVEDDAPLAVEDASAHPQVSDNPAVRDLGVAAYLDVPLRDPDGTALCAIDRASVRAGDVAARLGADEFAAVAQSTGAAGLEALARRVVLRLSAPIRVAGRRLRVGASVGLPVFPDDPGSPNELLARADRALYAAKVAGRGTWRRHGAAASAPRVNGEDGTFAVAAVLQRA